MSLPIHDILPLELIIQIALQFVQDPVNRVNNTRILCQLDSTFRKIITSTTLFWTDVRITRAAGSLELARLSSERAGQAPLTLAIMLRANPGDELITLDFRESVVAFLAKTAPRLKELTVVLEPGTWVTYYLKGTIARANMPLLEKLTLDELAKLRSITHGVVLGWDLPPPEDVPRLRSLTVDYTTELNEGTARTLHQLTKIHIRRPTCCPEYFMAATFGQLLKEAERLEELHLESTPHDREPPSATQSLTSFLPPWNDIVVLPNLRKLTLEPLDCKSWVHVLTHIDALRLEVLKPDTAFVLPSDPAFKAFASPLGIEPAQFPKRGRGVITRVVTVGFKPKRSIPPSERTFVEELITQSSDDTRTIRAFTFVTETAPSSYHSFIAHLAAFTKTDLSSVNHGDSLAFTFDVPSGRLLTCPTEDRWREVRRVEDLAYHPDCPNVFVFMGHSDGRILEGGSLGGNASNTKRRIDAAIIRDLVSDRVTINVD